VSGIGNNNDIVLVVNYIKF